MKPVFSSGQPGGQQGQSLRCGRAGWGTNSSVYDMVYFKCSCASQLEESSNCYRSGDQGKIWDGDICMFGNQ